MIMYSFFEEYDFFGKTIVPFNTHGGNGFSHALATINELEPGATAVNDSLSISRDDVHDYKVEAKIDRLSEILKKKEGVDLCNI